jgi:hypothetical protein
LLGLLLGVVALLALAALIYLGGMLLAALGIGAALSFGAALIIAAALLTVVALVLEIRERWQEYTARHGPPDRLTALKLIGLGLLSLTGGPQIVEAIRGRRLLSDQPLDEAARWELGIGGVLQAALFLVGVRVGLRALARGAMEMITPKGARVVAEPAPAGGRPTENFGGPVGRAEAAEVAPLPPEQRARLEELRKGRAGKWLAERRQAEAERLFEEKLQKAIADGMLEKLDPAVRAWLEADPRRLRLAFDPDEGGLRLEEARAILAAEERHVVQPPVRRAFDESGSSQGGDYIDGDGRYWDVVTGRADPKEGADTVLRKAKPRRPGAQGENVIVDMRHLTPAQREALKHALARRPKPAGTGEIRYLEP